MSLLTLNLDVDTKIDQIQAKINACFRKRGTDDIDLTLSGIEFAFEEIGQHTPEILIEAYNLLNKKLTSATDRADTMTELLGVSARLSVMYAEYEHTVDQIEEVLFPPKDSAEFGKLSEEDRKIQLKSRIAPYRTVLDILFYFLIYCAKVAPSTHQSVLNLERQLLGKE
jgi:hypothetical protein